MYTVVGKFKDSNMPKWKVKAETKAAAYHETQHISRTLAGLSSIAVYTPEGDKHCYDGAGEYLFTILAKDCASLGLKP